MKKNILLFVLCLFGFHSFAQDEVVPSEWAEKPKIVDGNKADCRTPFTLYDSSTRIFFKVANDSANIYLSFKISDKFEQMKVLKSGMVVGLTSKGDKKRKASIRYPLADGNDDSSPETQPQLMKKQDVKKLRDEVKLKKSLLELEGFTSENGLVSVDSNSFVHVGIDWDDKEVMYYDITIPFTEFFGDKFVANDLMSILTLKVKVNAMKGPDLAGSNRPQGMPEGGMKGGGMRPGGGMGPGGGSGSIKMDRGMQGAQNGSTMFSLQEFKQKFRLTIR
jgi:hypothetical protein